MTERPRSIEFRSISPTRRFVTRALRAGRHITPTHGLLQLDITEARRRLDRHRPSLSMTAFVVAAVARAAAAHPEVHAYRDWRGRLVLHHHVDVAILVETPTEDGTFPLAHVVRDADIRSVPELTAEIRRVQAKPMTSVSGRLLPGGSSILSRLPGAVSLLYWLMRRWVRIRRMAGTVAVTAVGMFAGGGGFGIGQPTVQTLTILVGGISRQPRVIEGDIEVRDVLDLTVTVDHNVVDGAPAARFAADLRRLIETAEPLPHPGG